MIDILSDTIGMAWKELVFKTLEHGHKLGNEGLELLDIRIIFKSDHLMDDEVLNMYADKEMILNMKKVFFTEEKNTLGHSYFNQICSPYNNEYKLDIIKILTEKKESKRATLTLNSSGSGKVPCINVINFLIRDNKLNIYYFSRGQDAYKKFYADAIVISIMQSEIAKELSVDIGIITGYITSAHIYNSDMHNINNFLSNK